MKKYISVMLSVIICLFALSPSAFAAGLGEKYTYTFEDGTTVEYYLDEYGAPYRMVNGYKIYIFIPTAENFITDLELTAEMKSEIKALRNGEVSPCAVPSSYYDLTTLPYYQNSRKYSKAMNFANCDVIPTSVMKIHPSHEIMLLKTANIVKLSDSSSKKITVYAYIYSESYNHIGTVALKGQDFSSGTTGFETNSDVYYTKVNVVKYDAALSFTFQAWTVKL